jgi:cytoskeletal protein RodZ
VTLLAPLKHLTALKFSKLSIFGGAKSSIKKNQPQISASIEETTCISPTPSEILQHIGAQLRQVREHQQMSIDNLSARTQIQPRLIQAIEEGHIEMLPEAVYVKGMVKRYANTLGLDGMEMSQQVPKWGSEVAMFEPTKIQTTGFGTTTTTQLKPLHVYLGYMLAIFGVGAGISHLLSNALKPQSQQVTGAVIQQQPVAAIPATAVRAPQPKQLPNVPIEISVKNPTWAQIGVDGATKFTGTLIVGTTLNLVATKQVTINTNNAGGILLSRDRQPPKPLGALGQKQSVTIKVSK